MTDKAAHDLADGGDEKRLREVLDGLERRLTLGLGEDFLTPIVEAAKDRDAILKRLDRLATVVLSGDPEVGSPSVIVLVREHERRISVLEDVVPRLVRLEAESGAHEAAIAEIQRLRDQVKWMLTGMALQGVGLGAIIAKLFGAF